MGELGLGQAVDVSDQPIEFGAQAGAFDGIGDAILNSLSLWERVGVRARPIAFAKSSNSGMAQHRLVGADLSIGGAKIEMGAGIIRAQGERRL